MRFLSLAAIIPPLGTLVFGLSVVVVGVGSLVLGLAYLLKVRVWQVMLALVLIWYLASFVGRYWYTNHRLDSCDAGDHEACAREGGLLLFSLDPAESAKGTAVLRRECEHGQLDCCGQLAYREALSKDPETLRLALADYEKSCEGGSMYGCGKAGRMYLEGPARRDATAAARLLGRACEGKDQLPAECTDLASLYRKGEGVPRDPVRAAELNRRLCDK